MTKYPKPPLKVEHKRQPKQRAIENIYDQYYYSKTEGNTSIFQSYISKITANIETTRHNQITSRISSTRVANIASSPYVKAEKHPKARELSPQTILSLPTDTYLWPESGEPSS